MERKQVKSNPNNETPINRYPILSPRHVPKNVNYNNTPYSLFDPVLYINKFVYPAKEPPKYW